MEQLWHKGMHFATCYAQCHLALLQLWITVDMGVKDSLANFFFFKKKPSNGATCHSYINWDPLEFHDDTTFQHYVVKMN